MEREGKSNVKTLLPNCTDKYQNCILMDPEGIYNYEERDDDLRQLSTSNIHFGNVVMKHLNLSYNSRVENQSGLTHKSKMDFALMTS